MIQVRHVVLVFALFASCRCGGASNNNASSDASATPSVTASGPAGPPIDAAARINVCAMLTQAELEQTTGLLAPPKASAGRSTCSWGTHEKKIVIVEVFQSSTQFDDSRRSFETLYKAKAQDVAGVGKRAFYLEGVASLPAATLVAERPQGGAVLVQISGKDFALSKAKDEVVAVAKIVVVK